MRNHAVFTMILAVGLLAGLPTIAFSDSAGIDPREIAIDKSLGGMAEGSRILSPGGTHADGQQLHGTPGSHAGSAAETHHPAVSAAAPGSSPAAARIGSPLGGTAVSGGSHEGTGANIGIETETPPGGPGDQTGWGSSSDNQEPVTGGGSETGIIEINADANLKTDNPRAGSQEVTSGTSGDQNSIIEADAGVDFSGGSPTVEAEVAIDPNASGGLVDAEAAASTDLVEQELTSSAGLEIDNGATTTAAETTTVSSETGGTAVPATNEVEGGVEADVEGVGAGDDVECNPADGILCPPKL